MGLDVFKRRCPHNMIIGPGDSCPRCAENEQARVVEARTRAIRLAGPPGPMSRSRVINLIGQDESRVIEQLGALRTDDGRIEPLLKTFEDGLPTALQDLMSLPYLDDVRVGDINAPLYRTRESSAYLYAFVQQEPRFPIFHRYIVRPVANPLTNFLRWELDEKITKELSARFGSAMPIADGCRRIAAWLREVAPSQPVTREQTVLAPSPPDGMGQEDDETMWRLLYDAELSRLRSDGWKVMRQWWREGFQWFQVSRDEGLTLMIVRSFGFYHMGKLFELRRNIEAEGGTDLSIRTAQGNTSGDIYVSVQFQTRSTPGGY